MSGVVVLALLEPGTSLEQVLFRSNQGVLERYAALAWSASGILAQPPIVIGNRILISGWYLVGVAGPRLGRDAIVLQLEFEPVHRAEDLPVHLFDHLGVAAKTAWIELLHLSGQLCDIFRSLWISGYHLPQLIQLTHTVPVAVFGVGGVKRIGGGLRLLPGLAVTVVAGVDVVPDGAVYRATSTVACRLRLLALARLTGILTLPVVLSTA
jgi:hypothetical protein